MRHVNPSVRPSISVKTSPGEPRGEARRARVMSADSAWYPARFSDRRTRRSLPSPTRPEAARFPSPRRISPPMIGRTPASSHARVNLTAPPRSNTSARARAGIPMAAARSAMSSGFEAPARRENADRAASSTKSLPLSSVVTLPERAIPLSRASPRFAAEARSREIASSLESRTEESDSITSQTWSTQAGNDTTSGD